MRPALPAKKSPDDEDAKIRRLAKQDPYPIKGPISWVGVIRHTDGYGCANELALRGLLERGADLHLVYHNTIDQRSFPFIHPLVREKARKAKGESRRQTTPRGDRVIFFPPPTYHMFPAENIVGYTMFETDGIPTYPQLGQDWMQIVNETCTRLMVPSPWCAEVFGRKAKVPIDVVPLGFDFDQWPAGKRPGGTFTFLMWGELHRRKGADIAVRAFRRAFPKQGDVRLILKSNCGTYWPEAAEKDGRIVLTCQVMDHRELLNLVRNAHVCLFPSRGEGFGMPAVEAMATGALVIMTDGTGLRDLCDDRYNIPLPSTGWEQAEYDPSWITKPGRWCVPDEDALVERMRWAYENDAKARAVGDRAARWVRRMFTLEKQAEGITTTMLKAGFK